MDDDSNRSTAVDETPRNNGSLKSRRKSISADGEKDSDSGKENGPLCEKKEKEAASGKELSLEHPVTKEKVEAEDGELPEKESKEKIDGKESNATETSGDLVKVETAEQTKKEEDVDREAHSVNEEEENASEGIIECNASEEQDDAKLEIEDHKLDDVSRPLSPAEEDDVSHPSSPSHHLHTSTHQQIEESGKRESSDSDQDAPIVKKMKMTPSELAERDRMVCDYVESASGTSLDEIQRSSEKLQQEISTLNTLARAKEQEWNNIIRMKKIKEEMLLRLHRKKDVMLIMMSSPGKGDMNFWDLPYDLRTGASALDDVPICRSKIEPGITIPKSHLSKSSLKAHNSVLSAQQLQSSGGVSILKSGQNQMPVMMVPVVSSNAGAHSTLNLSSSTSGTTTMTRISESSGKDKGKSHRPILPKPTIVLPPSSTSVSSNNGQNPVIGEGRQGPILDVRSIIADYRSKHPGDVPRRGRRLKSALSPNSSQGAENLVTSTRVSGSSGILSMASVALGSGSQMRPGLVAPSPADIPDLGFLLNNAEANRQETSRPSSADSSRSGAPAAQLSGEGGNVSSISFKDVLVQFAKLSQNEQRHEPQIPTTTSAATSVSTKPPPYPEVTLHPVLTQHSPPHQSPSTSLLHGILTKSTTMHQQQRAESNSRVTNFSPTLARLLTAPERVPGNVPNTTVTPFHGASGPVSISDLLSTNKTRNEITITPVGTQQSMKTKEEVVLLEEEQEDSADRLVIDESVDGDRREGDDDQGSAQDISPDEVPECQGCHQRPAQFVCAGCGNQWYCSRDCQVSAWDEHSEVCSG